MNNSIFTLSRCLTTCVTILSISMFNICDAKTKKTELSLINQSTTLSFSNSLSNKDSKVIWKKITKNDSSIIANYKKMGISHQNLGGFQYDVDGDGVKDWFVSLNHIAFCGGKMFCNIHIYPSILKDKEITTCLPIDVNDTIQFNNTKNNGLYDFKPEQHDQTFVFNGQEYCHN